MYQLKLRWLLSLTLVLRQNGSIEYYLMTSVWMAHLDLAIFSQMCNAAYSLQIFTMHTMSLKGSYSVMKWANSVYNRLQLSFSFLFFDYLISIQFMITNCLVISIHISDILSLTSQCCNTVLSLFLLFYLPSHIPCYDKYMHSHMIT